jgi:putative glutamine amidotransferase
MSPFVGRVDHVRVTDPEEADVLWFTGGEDVDPSFYGEPPHPCSYSSYRRTYEEEQMLRMYPDKFKIGTCRGHQQFNVFDGGKLIQHLNNHAGQNHGVVDVKDNYMFTVNSAHHQAIIPSEHCQALLYSVPRASVMQGMGMDGSVINHENVHEVEAAYWPNMNAFGVQFHPEWMHDGEGALDWFINKFNELYREHKKGE